MDASVLSDASEFSDVLAALDASPSDPASFYESYLTALCENAIRCEPRDDDADGSQGACHPSYTAARDETLRAIMEGRTAFDSDAAAACLTELRTTCPRFLEPSACAFVFRGVAGPGTACLVDGAFSTECAMGLTCEVNRTCPGACVAPAEIGSECTAAGCVAGAGCSVEGLCAPVSEGGTRCVDEVGCVEGFYCSRGAVCEPEARVGEECLETRECEGGAWCLLVEGSRRCVDLSTVGESGPCIRGYWWDTCPSELVCRVVGHTFEGTCVRGGREGYACGPDEPCGLGLRCTSGLCRVVAGPGEACDSATKCPFSHYCSDARCAPLPALGDECMDAARCFLSECIDSVCTPTAPPGNEGEPCGPAEPPCADGLVCRFADGDFLCLPDCTRM